MTSGDRVLRRLVVLPRSTNTISDQIFRAGPLATSLSKVTTSLVAGNKVGPTPYREYVALVSAEREPVGRGPKVGQAANQIDFEVQR